METSMDVNLPAGVRFTALPMPVAVGYDVGPREDGGGCWFDRPLLVLGNE